MGIMRSKNRTRSASEPVTFGSIIMDTCISGGRSNKYERNRSFGYVAYQQGYLEPKSSLLLCLERK
jgi:hypothetical protein